MKITPIENRGIDENLFHTLCTLFEKIPIHKTLGMSLTYLGPGRSYENDGGAGVHNH